ncbi:PREDICTED: BRCA2-interacting transcriptional repressor EMSY-like [Acropora digitifera]|uniref:BRCA2-interacting transcriptional repressor EMSY-like n=1 Tax=Acropora digitifera TaxID=70779 RepID=UPI00077B1F46|nr:PREDICTED: BRCA2-interacting transcriptional repressor EMSY-like [Acropora digitifera]
MSAEMMDITRDESKRILRRLELEAYSSIISAFRAQGELSRTKKKILQDLGTQLSISTERHRAEVRRAYSDDRLAIVAESIYGAGSCAEWAAEGRRLVPLMPRLVPQTVFSASATAAANAAAAANAKVHVSSGVKPSGSPNSVNTNGNSSTSPKTQSNLKSVTVKQQPQAGSPQCSDTDGYDDDGKPKRKRRLSVTSLNKPVTKVTIPTPTLVSKSLTKQTTSVSTMTKSGKTLPGPAGTIKAIPRVSQLPASASQVKLLTKTIAVSQAICQAKTVLSYKAMSSVTSSTAKAQTVVTQSTHKTQTKLASGTPPKAVMSSKTPISSGMKNLAGGTVNPAITANPIGVALKTGLQAQLAARHKAKQPVARFKPLPGTVKFKSVTPATMGTCSTVTMVTPSPSSQATSALPATSTQPVVRVIHVPGTGGVGVSKPVVVMTTGPTKAAVASALPGVSSSASLTKSTSQATSALPATSTQPVVRVIHVPGTGGVGVSKPVVVMTTGPTKAAVASALPGVSSSASLTKSTSQVSQNTSVTKSAVTSVATQPSSSKAKVFSALSSIASSASKTVGMTTLVGGTKRVVLSVPASLQPTTSTSIPATSSQGIVITKTQGVKLTSSAVAQSPSAPKKDTKITASLTMVSPKLSPQITPGLSAPTVTTQVRSRPLPAILPAPPKPSSLQQAASGLPATAGTRKLPTILPAPAKSVNVYPTVIVPVVTAVGAKLLSSVSVSATKPGSCTAGISPLNEVVGQKYLKVAPAGQDTISAATDQAFLKVQENSEKSEPTETSGLEVPVTRDQNPVTECDNNTSSEDDSLLMCSETIDSNCGIAEVPTAIDFFPTVAESTPVKGQSDEGAHSALPSSKEQEINADSLSLQDTGVSLAELITEDADQEDLDSKTNPCDNQLVTGTESIENVMVQRLDATSEITEIVAGTVPENLYPESLHDEEPLEPVLDVGLSSSLQSPRLDDQNVKVNCGEELVTNTGLPVDNALHIIESFVESMEANSGEKCEPNLPGEDSQIGHLQSSCTENLPLPDVGTVGNENEKSEQIITGTETDKDHNESQPSTSFPRFDEESWDGPIDVLSTSTSSSNSASESTDLTEKEIRALEAFGNIRTSGRKRKPNNLSLMYSLQDCEEVFRFYETEYAKMLERWEKCHVSPAKKPRVA